MSSRILQAASSKELREINPAYAFVASAFTPTYLSAAKEYASHLEGPKETLLENTLLKAASLYAVDLLRSFKGTLFFPTNYRLAFSTEKMLAWSAEFSSHVRSANLDTRRLIFILPATFEGTRAAAHLEKQGQKTALSPVYSLVQAALAAEQKISYIITPEKVKKALTFSTYLEGLNYSCQVISPGAPLKAEAYLLVPVEQPDYSTPTQAADPIKAPKLSAEEKLTLHEETFRFLLNQDKEAELLIGDFLRKEIAAIDHFLVY